MPNIETVRNVLTQCGQAHLLAFVEELSPAHREAFVGELAKVDWRQLGELIASDVLAEPATAIPTDIQPPEILPAHPVDEKTVAAYAQARQAGGRLLEGGKVAAFVVAGGQGTRLGYDGPKGCFEVTPVKHKSLFETFAEQIRAAARRYGHAVPWYIMTSPANDEATRAFFADHAHFGLPGEDVIFFSQGTMPAVGLDGKVLLAGKGQLAVSPNGHGGSLAALADSGALADMAGRGVEYISYFQVDNPLTKVLDPLFLGLHAERGAEMSAKALPKREPLEKLGNFCLINGRATVIEYSDLPDELAYATGPDGRLRFPAGSIAIHVFSRSFVERLTAGGRCELPFHRAAKKVPCIDEAGKTVTPEAPNAIKLEMFVFDALPLAAKTVILETSRIEEFSPVKNASGKDSPATCLRDQVARAETWLNAAGVAVPLDAEGRSACAIEISPTYALDAAALAEKISPDLKLEPGAELYLGD